MTKINDLTGQRFGRLVVIERAAPDAISQHRRARWLCQCDCGGARAVLGLNLIGGHVHSCGCIRVERARELGRQRRKSG